MLPDYVAPVIIDVHATHNAGLGATVHDLAIEKERRLPVSQEDALGDELFESLARLGIDPGIVGIDVPREIDIRASDMEKAVGVVPRQLDRFTAAHHIVGYRGHLGGQLGGRSDGAEGMESH
jgi:hypothetical protein